MTGMSYCSIARVPAKAIGVPAAVESAQRDRQPANCYPLVCRGRADSLSRLAGSFSFPIRQKGYPWFDIHGLKQGASVDAKEYTRKSRPKDFSRPARSLLNSPGAVEARPGCLGSREFCSSVARSFPV